MNKYIYMENYATFPKAFLLLLFFDELQTTNCLQYAALQAFFSITSLNWSFPFKNYTS